MYRSHWLLYTKGWFWSRCLALDPLVSSGEGADLDTQKRSKSSHIRAAASEWLLYIHTSVLPVWSIVYMYVFLQV